MYIGCSQLYLFCHNKINSTCPLTVIVNSIFSDRI
uniref:Uncharacterized protein n=1 Tax=Anguilla anguilla TaxID=7936 RepID=A0A0E9Q8L6_ANGAN